MSIMYYKISVIYTIVTIRKIQMKRIRVATKYLPQKRTQLRYCRFGDLVEGILSKGKGRKERRGREGARREIEKKFKY